MDITNLNAKVDKSPEFQSAITDLMEKWNVPGCAIAVVKDNRVILSQGFGFRDIDQKLPVDENTVFAIGSTSKAFTAVTIAQLVDQGHVAWDMPIINYMPEFELWDQAAGQQMTVRDLLSHRSGLPRHDAVWYGSSFDRRELIRNLKYLQPSADFRSTFQYQNLMFTAAGYLVECVLGKTWESFTQENILDRLSMRNTNFSVQPLSSYENVAKPYSMTDGSPKEILYRNVDAIAPAGGINSNLQDLVKWISIHLNGGRFGKNQIVSEQNIQITHTPTTFISSSFGRLLQAFQEIGEESYTLGWFAHTYRGVKLLRHGGHIDGFSTQISFMPEIDAGVIVLTNIGGSSFMNLPTFLVYDLLLEKPVINWSKRLKDKEGLSQIAAEKARGWYTIKRKHNKPPSHHLNDYVGDYSHPAYGLVKVALEGWSLMAYYKGQSFELNHYHYNTFDWLSSSSKSSSMKLSFHHDLLGEITSLELPLEAEVDPIRFKRMPGQGMSEGLYLEQFVGLYDWDEKEAIITIRKKELSFAIPQLETLTLMPQNTPLLFRVKGKPNWMVEFQVFSEGSVASVSLITPSGLYTAAKQQHGN